MHNRPLHIDVQRRYGLHALSSKRCQVRQFENCWSGNLKLFSAIWNCWRIQLFEMGKCCNFPTEKISLLSQFHLTTWAYHPFKLHFLKWQGLITLSNCSIWSVRDECCLFWVMEDGNKKIFNLSVFVKLINKNIVIKIKNIFWEKDGRGYRQCMG